MDRYASRKGYSDASMSTCKPLVIRCCEEPQEITLIGACRSAVPSARRSSHAPAPAGKEGNVRFRLIWSGSRKGKDYQVSASDWIQRTSMMVSKVLTVMLRTRP